jgi:hypothetical protein
VTQHLEFEGKCLLFESQFSFVYGKLLSDTLVILSLARKMTQCQQIKTRLISRQRTEYQFVTFFGYFIVRSND